MTLSLVLLPGLLCDSDLWRHQISRFGGKIDCRVADLTGADSIAALARAVLDRAPDRFALAGLSMGGYVALEILRQAPERVRRRPHTTRVGQEMRPSAGRLSGRPMIAVCCRTKASRPMRSAMPITVAVSSASSSRSG